MSQHPRPTRYSSIRTIAAVARSLFRRARGPSPPAHPRLAVEPLEARDVPAPLLVLQNEGGNSTLNTVDAATGRVVSRVRLNPGLLRDIAPAGPGLIGVGWTGPGMGRVALIDPVTGGTTDLLSSPLLADPIALAADGNTAFAVAGGYDLIRIDLAGRRVERVGTLTATPDRFGLVPGFSRDGDLALAPGGTLYYASNALFRVDPATARATQVGPLFDPQNGWLKPFTGLAYADARLLAVDASGRILSVNPASGAYSVEARSPLTSASGAAEFAPRPSLPPIRMPDLGRLDTLSAALFVTLVNETRAPSGDRGYSPELAWWWFDEARREMQTIVVALANRVAKAPGLFPNHGQPPASFMDVLRTPGTIQGLAARPGEPGVAVTAANRARIADVFRIANDPRDPRREANQRYLTIAWDVTRQAAVAGPAALPFADPFAWFGGTFAWFAANYPGRPQGAFVPRPVGVIGGTVFYTLKPHVRHPDGDGIRLIRTPAGTVTGIEVAFSRPMEEKTVEAPGGYTVSLRGGKKPVPVEVVAASYDDARRVATLRFATPVALGPDQRLRLSIAPTVADVEGYRLVGQMTFTRS